GRQQSPIDISDGARLELEPITFSYAPAALRIIDNGHTIQVNIDEGRYILIGGKRFDLKQFHFHKPAEERVGGRSYDLVAHLVHKSVEGKLAVVAVLFELGHDNPFLRRLWPYLPMEEGTESILPDVRLELDKLLPENRGYFTYMGSLTTPPCTEGVLWMVMKTPVPISIEQLAVFARLYPMNARPLQSANGRLIKESL
ncbi:MAG: carbonic anhydrase, partial [Burkholderiales bacterium]